MNFRSFLLNLESNFSTDREKRREKQNEKFSSGSETLNALNDDYVVFRKNFFSCLSMNKRTNGIFALYVDHISFIQTSTKTVFHLYKIQWILNENVIGKHI